LISGLLFFAGAFFFGSLFQRGKIGGGGSAGEDGITAIKNVLDRGPEMIEVIERVEKARQHLNEVKVKVKDAEKAVKVVEAEAASRMNALGVSKALEGIRRLETEYRAGE
jgi:hypothetical protein